MAIFPSSSLISYPFYIYPKSYIFFTAINFLTQQLFIECLLCARLYARVPEGQTARWLSMVTQQEQQDKKANNKLLEDHVTML